MASRGLSPLSLVVAMFLFLARSPSWAADAKSFMVSALLKRDGSDAIVKLVHSRVTTAQARRAVALFVDRLQVDYPGYIVLDTLATELDESRTQCSGRDGLWADAWTPAVAKEDQDALGSELLAAPGGPATHGRPGTAALGGAAT